MRRREMAAGLVSLAAAPRASFAQAQYDPGASDTEIKLAQTMPYSGPVSAAATVGYACTAYFETVNKAGGINGRKVTLVSLDDGYSPPKTVELTRRLVEEAGRSGCRARRCVQGAAGFGHRATAATGGRGCWIGKLLSLGSGPLPHPVELF